MARVNSKTWSLAWGPSVLGSLALAASACGGGASRGAKSEHDASSRQHGANQQSAAQSKSPPSLTVDLEQLDEELQERVREQYRMLPSPCDWTSVLLYCQHPPQTNKASNDAAGSCAACRTAQRHVLRLVQEGYDTLEIEESYETRFSPYTMSKLRLPASAPSEGPSDAPVVIVGFSDFSCPHCQRAHARLSALRERFPKKVRLIFMQFPIEEIHPHALLAARASLAAHKQEKFWPMADALFSAQGLLSKAEVIRIATELGLNRKDFVMDLESTWSEKEARAQRAEGERIGVRGTPAIFINAHRYDESLTSLEAYVREAL